VRASSFHSKIAQLKEAFMLTLTKSWWALVLRGVLAIVFALLMFAAPAITLAYLIALFGVYAIFDGVLLTIAAFASGTGNWWALLLAGILGIVAGGIAFVNPGLTALTLLYCIAFWSVTAGISQIIAAIRLRKEIEGEWLLGLAGAISVVFGIILVASPGAGALGLILVIASYAFLAGIVLIGLGIKLRSFRRSVRAAVA
jgi:uncharacterized membrane protein HdeD (DUF308 family)